MATLGAAPQQPSPLEQRRRRVTPPKSARKVTGYGMAIVATHDRRRRSSPVTAAADVTSTLHRRAGHWLAANDVRDSERSTPVELVEDGLC